MDSQMIIRIDEKTKDKFYKVARTEGKSASEKVREMVEEYVAKNDISTIVDDIWNRIGTQINEKGIEELDIENVIKEVRKSK